MVLLSPKYDTPERKLTLSSTKQRCVKGRVTSECQPSTLALRLSKGWEVSLGHQSCGPSKLSSRVLATGSLACLAPSSHVWWHPPQVAPQSATSLSVSDGCRQNSVPVAFPLFGQWGGCRQWGHFRNMSFPCLLMAVGGIRTSQKQVEKTKIPVNRRAKEVEYETLQPLRSEATFSGNPWDQSFCNKIGRQREMEAWQFSKRSWFFVFLVAL